MAGDDEPRIRGGADDPRERQRRQARSTGAERAARVYVREHLGWLRGCPDPSHGPDRASALQGGASDDGPGAEVLPWRTRSSSGVWTSIQVDRERLRVSFNALRGARRRFPRALPRVVGDVAAWEMRMEARLRRLQPLVHGGEESGTAPEPPPEPGAPFTDDELLIWLAWEDADVLKASRERLRQWARALFAMGEALGPGLRRRFAIEVVAPDGSAAGMDLARQILEYAPAYAVTTGASSTLTSLHEARKSLKVPKKIEKYAPEPSGPWAGAGQGADHGSQEPGRRPFAEELARELLRPMDPQLRELAMAKLEELSPLTWLSEWEAWWKGVDAGWAEARTLVDLARDVDHNTRAIRQLGGLVRERFDDLIEDCPAQIEPDGMFSHWRQWLDATPPDATELVMDCLRLLPAGSTGEEDEDNVPQGRTVLALTWLGWLRNEKHRRGMGMMVEFRRRLERLRSAEAKDEHRLFFARAVTNKMLSFDWGAHQIPWENQACVFECIERISAQAYGASPADPGAQDPDADSGYMKLLRKFPRGWTLSSALEGFAAELTDPARILSLLRLTGGQIDWDAARAVTRFAQELSIADDGSIQLQETEFGVHPPRDEAYFAAWSALDESASEGVTLLIQATRHRALRQDAKYFAACGAPPADLVHFARLWTNASRVHGLDAVAPPPQAEDGSSPGTGPLAHWIPAAILPSAKRLLAEAGPRALAKQASPELVDPAVLRTEVAALKERIAADEGSLGAKADHLRQRLAALEERLAHLTSGAHSLSPSAESAVRLRLERAAGRARLRRWTESLMRTLLPELGPEIVESISLGSDKQAEHVIAGIRQLKRRPRQLALRLMKERTGPRPWDLREDPANAEWQERARGQGIDLTPWESDEPQFTAASPSGVELCFAFEHDPLEVMKMGLWFDTCLAPDSFNFFSTLANAADANKRVLVARDPKGTARARCLIAVSSSWNLIAFHVYAHDDGDWVRERIAAWLTELAESMGVTVAPAGSVPKLVASSWYDDGPVDITGVLAPMTPKSPFHRQLRKADEDETCALVTAELGEEVVRASLEPLLGMDPIFGSARRIASFAPFLLEAPLPRQLAIRTLDRLAQDHPETAAGILENWGRGRAFHRLQYEWGEDIQLARGLRHLGQARMALKVLRRRGAQGADEPAHQHETAANLDALGNRPAAMAIWRRLAQDGCERAATLLKTT